MASTISDTWDNTFIHLFCDLGDLVVSVFFLYLTYLSEFHVGYTVCTLALSLCVCQHDLNVL